MKKRLLKKTEKKNNKEKYAKLKLLRSCFLILALMIIFAVLIDNEMDRRYIIERQKELRIAYLEDLLDQTFANKAKEFRITTDRFELYNQTRNGHG